MPKSRTHNGDPDSKNTKPKQSTKRSTTSSKRMLKTYHCNSTCSESPD